MVKTKNNKFRHGSLVFYRDNIWEVRYGGADREYVYLLVPGGDIIFYSFGTDEYLTDASIIKSPLWQVLFPEQTKRLKYLYGENLDHDCTQE